MQRRFLLVIFVAFFSILSACSEKDELDGLKMLDVKFDVPETAEVNETITLQATVTYGDDPVTDPRQMEFEVWERGQRDDGEYIEAENHGDGTYTTEVTFDHDGIFEMYAHTTAHGLHTMPFREIIVGEGGDYDDVDEDDFHTEGFDMHFMNPEDAKVDSDTELMVHLMMNEDAFEDAEVRYEIWNYDISDKHDWIDAKETQAGEYVANHVFSETGTYTIQIHVEADDDLHEHKEYEIEVKE